jgi:hypothetical protein
LDLNPDGLISGEGQVEGLALILRALTRPTDPATAYDDFCACLGVSVAPVAVRGDVRPEAWPTYGRDIFLEPVARAWGLRLRNLHPPDVGVDMARAEEFDQHFELSYRPLICRALEHGQPVIAWRGWDGESIPSWGIITEVVDDAFTGHVAISGESARLSAPAWQCCVVETSERREPPRDAVLEMALRYGAAMLRGESTTPPGRTRIHGILSVGVIVGPQAWSVWRERIARAEAVKSTLPGAGAFSSFEGISRYLLHSRRSATRFWERMARNDGEPDAAPLQKLAERCRETQAVLEQLAELICGGGGGGESAAWNDIFDVLDEAGRQDDHLLETFDEATRTMYFASEE